MVNYLIGFLTASMIAGLIWSFINNKWQSQKKSHQDFVQLVENSMDFIYYAQIYPELKYIYLSPSAEKYFGVGAIKNAYENPDGVFQRIHPEDSQLLMKKLSGKLDCKKPIIQRWKGHAGNYRWFEEYATPTYKDGILVAIQGVLRNIDERKELEARVEYQLYHDTLTGLHNREHSEIVFDRLNTERDTSVAILLCDLDELEKVNDTQGHKMGDQLIKAAAQILNRLSSEVTTVARLGGDEFVVIATGVSSEEAMSCAERINKEIEDYNNQSTDLKVKLSIGIATASNSVGNMVKLFTDADKDMYLNKRNRKQQLV